MTHELKSDQRIRWQIQKPRRTSAESQTQPPVYEKPLTIRERLNQEPHGKVAQSYKFAEKIHEGQVRFSGEPYISHPEAVADIINTEFYNGAPP